MSAKKKPASVLAAEALEHEKRDAVNAAREALQLAELEYTEACCATREALVQADDLLPKCRMVSIAWRTDKETETGRAVIIRKTPGGMLVARRVGNEIEMRFKFSQHRGVYVEAAKKRSWSSHIELRDVPQAWMPATQETPDDPR